MRLYGSLWVFMFPYKCLCILMDFNGSLCVLISPDASLWIVKGPY